ncbi:MAG UNVERIFIED_CONTAM: pyridoxal-dependent decarboxylase [Planctomycetaceae bacterium]
MIVCSDQAHYAGKTAASWLGLGLDNVVSIPSTPASEMRTCLLESELRRLLREGRRIACIIATTGTTDAFGLDALDQIREIRDRLADEFHLDYRPHLHADAVIGWAWSVFREYDFAENPLEFPDRTLRALAGTHRRIRHLHLADSIGIDYHKTGFAPYISSAILVQDAADLRLLSRDQQLTPYLFQSGTWNPGRFSLETSRSGCGTNVRPRSFVAAGSPGPAVAPGTPRHHGRNHALPAVCTPCISVMNPDNFGPVTLFRVYPDQIDTFEFPRREQTESRLTARLQAINDYNRRIFHRVQTEALQGEGVVISMTDRFRESDAGAPIVALKSYIMSPFSDSQYVQAVVDSIDRARAAEGAVTLPD